MSFKITAIAFASVTAFAIAHGAAAQEIGGIPVPDEPVSYDVPPSTGGGGGRPDLRLGTGAAVQFGGPRDTFVLPDSQILYRADDQIGVVLIPIDEDAAQVPPSNGGGGGRPGFSSEMEEETAEEIGYNDYDPPDYMEDCAHPWHGVCPGCDDYMSETEAAQLAEYEARLAAAEARSEAAETPAILYDTPRFDGFQPSLAYEPAGDSDW